MSNLPVQTVGQFVQVLQSQVNGIQNFLDTKFVPPRYNLDMGGQAIEGSSSVETKELVLNEIPVPAAAVVGTLKAFTDGTDVLTINSAGTVETLLTASAAAGTYLPLAGGTMTGNIAMGGNDITNVDVLSGATNSRTADNIVSNAGASVAGNVASFSGVSGKVITDSGIVSANVVTNAGVSVAGNVATFSGVSGKIITDSGASLSQYLPLAGGTMTGAIAMGTNDITNVGLLSGATNSRTADNIVSNAGASVAGNVATFSGVSGKVITDSGASLSQYLPLAGGTMTGAIAMGTNNITGTGTISCTSASLRDGAIASGTRFVQNTSVTLGNTTTETSLLTGTTVGNLAFSATQLVGSSFHVSIGFHLTVAAAATIRFRYKINGVTVLDTGATIGGAAFAAEASRQEADFVVKAATLESSCETVVNGVLPMVLTNAPAYDNTILNTLTLTGEWSAAAVGNTITIDYVRVNAHYAT